MIYDYGSEDSVHWYVVASQKEARVFIKTSDRKQLGLLKTLTNPLGLVKRRDLIKKEAGRGVKSIGRYGSVSYSEPKRRDPHEEAIVQFVKVILKFLESERLKKSFESLTIVAEPHLLGIIRSQMRSDLQGSVTRWIKKGLQKTPQKKLVDFLLPKKSRSSSSKHLRI